MPEICRFLGISILMYFNDHPPPHFHVRYNEYRATVDPRELRVLEGVLPGRVLGLVVEWATMHQHELLENWETIRITGQWQKIEPLV
jgi:hypothetical protein